MPLTSTITQKGQVTIPGELRKALKLKPRDRVEFTLLDGEVRIRPMARGVRSIYGAVRPLSRPEDFKKIRKEVFDALTDRSSPEAS